MKTLAILLLAGMCVIDAFADDQPLLIDTKLPKIRNDWVRRADSGATGGYSWVNFDNKNKTGEVLSFVAWKVPPTVGVMEGPVAQASTEMFLSNGSARLSKSVLGRPIRDTVRHRVLLIQIGADDLKRDIKAIEYTYIYESDSNSPVTMAHGYCFVVGETVLFVQHTSPRPISSELAFEMAGGLLSQHFGKPHSFFKGAILQNNS